MYKYTKKKVNGYFTIEAAMIMPLVILLLAFLFDLSFYLYNRCILPQDAYILAFRTSSLCGEQEKEVRSYLEKDSKRQIGKKYIGLNVIEKDLRIHRGKVEIELQGRMRIFGKSLVLHTIKKAGRDCPVKNIRRVRQIKKLEIN